MSCLVGLQCVNFNNSHSRRELQGFRIARTTFPRRNLESNRLSIIPPAIRLKPYRSVRVLNSADGAFVCINPNTRRRLRS